MLHAFVVALGTILATLGVPVTASAQTVAVESARTFGYGWMFRQGDTCYLVFPEHVAGDEFEITALSAAPVETGTGTVIRPFWEGIDLALAVLRGGIEDRCEGELGQLVAPIRGNPSTALQLERFSMTGEVIRDPLRLAEMRYLTFNAALASGGDPVQRGNSGAFAFVGDRPVGMAYRSAENESAIFMRSEEIHMNVARYLSEHGNTFTPERAPPTLQPLEGALPLSLIRVTAPPVSPVNAPENMLRDGIYVFDLAGSARAAFRIEDGRDRMSRVVVTTPLSDAHILPRTILIEVSAEAEGDRWSFVGRYEMGPDGLLDTGPIAERRARRIRLTVVGAWGTGPVAIGRVSVY